MPVSRLKSSALIAGLALLSSAPLAGAAPIVWTGAAGDNNWSNAANWNLGRVPNSTDDALCTLPASSGEIQVRNNAGCNSLSTTQRLVLSGGSITIQTSAQLYNGLLMFTNNGYPILNNHGSITVYGTSSLFNGVIRQAPGTSFDFNAASTTNIFTADVIFQGGAFTNNGAMEVRGSGFYLGNYNPGDPFTIFVNSSTGGMKFVAPGTISDFSIGGQSILLNEGNFEVATGGSVQIAPDIELWNHAAGFVNVGVGALTVNTCTNLDSDSKLNGASWYVHDGGSISLGANLLGIAADTNVYIYGPGSTISGIATATDIRGNLFISNGANVTIAQTIYGSLTNRGLIFIGADGQLITTGSYVQYPEGTLRHAIDGPGGLVNPAVISYDRPILHGTLVVDFYDTNLIQPGAGFPMVVGTCCTTGAFDAVNILPDNGYSAAMNYSNGQAVLRVPVACVGDFNNDLVVNTADLVTFLGRFGTLGDAGITGDLNFDGSVNTADLVTFLGRFGSSCL